MQTTDTGFMWGPCVVTRLIDDRKHGIWLEIAGDKEFVTIRVTNSGKLRLGKPQKATAQTCAAKALGRAPMVRTCKP